MGLNCSFVELEAKFNASSLLLNSRHFDKRKHSWQWCNENSQNSETRALTKKPVAKLLVERYKKRHPAAQVRSANVLRGIFKFSEIFGTPSYIATVWIYLRQVQFSWIIRPNSILKLVRFDSFVTNFVSIPIHVKTKLSYSLFSNNE